MRQIFVGTIYGGSDITIRSIAMGAAIFSGV